jgi:hypothetical protein
LQTADLAKEQTMEQKLILIVCGCLLLGDMSIAQNTRFFPRDLRTATAAMIRLLTTCKVHGLTKFLMDGRYRHGHQTGINSSRGKNQRGMTFTGTPVSDGTAEIFRESLTILIIYRISA